MFYLVRGKCWTLYFNNVFTKNSPTTYSFRRLGTLHETNTWPNLGLRQNKASERELFISSHGYRPVVSCSLFSTKSFLSSYAGQQTLKTKLWRIVRLLFIITGGLVWTAPVILYASIATGIVQVDVEERELQGAGDDLSGRLLSFYNVQKGEEGSYSHSKEVDSKDFALHKIWEKLRSEEGVTRKFGSPVHISGFRVSHALDRSTVEDSNFKDKGSTKSADETKENGAWNASCYIEGPKHTGILDVGFTKVNEEWIPVSLHLETLQKSGEVVCNVSASPPNGLTRFTRLSDI